MRSRFRQIDVFTEVPFRGNPVAVVCEAAGMSSEEMQALATWTNLSETTFLLPPVDSSADYRVRIFTPGGELPFAGHPTLGSAHAWLAEGGRPKAAFVVQECGVGLVRVHRQGEPRSNGVMPLAFEAPPVRVEPVEASLLQKVAQVLGIERQSIRDARLLDNGPKWLSLLLPSAAGVLALEPDHSALARLAMVGVVGPYPPGGGEGCDFEVRAFAAPVGIREDPVTGSLNAALAEWLVPSGLAPSRYLVSQGRRLGRSGRVSIERTSDGRILVGGASVTCIEGALVV